jgi:hypothetical protein
VIHVPGSLQTAMEAAVDFVRREVVFTNLTDEQRAALGE